MSSQDTFARAATLDAGDPLASMRSLFHIPDGIVYLDGNSLGCQPRSVETRLKHVVDTEWREHLITAWNRDGWIELSESAGTKIARLVGAAPGSVRVCDSTTVNLFKALTAALSLKGRRGTILSERGNFPTDLYVAQTLAASMPDVMLRTADREVIADAIADDVSVVMVTEVDYRTGHRHDMRALTERAHQHGALIIWDLAHSAGAFTVDLAASGADFAVGCGYKYLNGGPGAPAFIYVRPDHYRECEPLPSGWFGHAQPFAFIDDFVPADGIDRFQVGTPPVLSMAALDAALDIFSGVSMAQVEAKSRALAGFFIDCIDPFAEDYGLCLATPRDADRRGSHVSWHHEQAYPVMQALIAGGVVGDMRAPDFLRFGFTPLYTSYGDVAKAADMLRIVLQQNVWDQPRFHQRAKVT